MTIAELFVNLGVKGTDKTITAFTGITKGLKDITVGSFAAYAGVVGVFYGMQRLMGASTSSGTALAQFANLTGLSTQSLQQWQYAARQAGVSSEDLTSSVKSVQSAMTNMLLGKGAPEGLNLVAQRVGFDMNRARDTFYVMKQLQEFSKGVPADLANTVMRSFGISDGTLLAMRQQAFSAQQLNKAPTYSDGELNRLQKVGAAWANIGSKIEMAMGHLVAKDGLKITNDISKTVDQIIKLTTELTKLAEKVRVFEWIGLAFKGWGMMLSGVNGKLEDWLGPDDKTGKKEPLGDVVNKKVEWLMDELLKPRFQASDAISRYITPSGGAAPTNNVSINNNFQHDGKDAHKTGESVSKSVVKAFNLIPKTQAK